MEFDVTKYSGIDGQTKVRMTLKTGSQVDAPYLEAAVSGLTVHGKFEFMDNSDLQAFAKAMGGAWKEHLKLKPKLVSTLSGH